jgi:long-chain acyl-CoA synthetase
MTDAVITLNQAILQAMDTFAARTCFYVKEDRLFQGISFRYVRTQSLRLAAHFRNTGLRNGDRLAILATNRVEWLIGYLAGHFAGVVVVPVRTSLPDGRIIEVISDCGASIAIVGDDYHCGMLQSHCSTLPSLRSVLIMDDCPPIHELSAPLDPILTEAISAGTEEAMRDLALNMPPSALSVIHYTTGADGRLRGAVFNQEQELGALQSMAEWFPLDRDDLGFSTPHLFSELPVLHATLHYLMSGVPNAIAPGPETSFEDLQRISPTVTLTSPYEFEHIFLHVMQSVEQMPRSSQDVFRWALEVGKRYHAAGLSASAELRESYRRADMTFFSNIRGTMGGRLNRLYLAGAPLLEPWRDFAEAIGLSPLDVYSVTSAGGIPAASRATGHPSGSCGRITRGYQIRIADDGEVLVRGETVALGIWNDAETADPSTDNASMIDPDGWLHTGDLGRFDSEGYLYLTGHKQSPLILATGRKVQAGIIEQLLTSSQFVTQAVVYGEGRRYLAALIVPDYAAIKDHMAHEDVTTEQVVGADDGPGAGGQELTPDHPAVVEAIERVVESVNAALDRWEQVERYTILQGPFTDRNGNLITEPALQHAEISENYADAFEAMYPSATPFQESEVTHVELEPEHLRELLEKEGILDAWMNDAGIEFLFDLARAKQIDAPSMVHICETVAAIAQMHNEEQPLSTAFIVGNPAKIARVLPECVLQLRQYDHIRRMRRAVTTLARIVDGQVLGYAVDTHGFVRGIHRLGMVLEDSTEELTGVHYRRHAAISRECGAVVFSIPPGGRQVRVFADGKLAGRYANGVWLAESTAHVDAALARLAETKSYNLELLRRLLRCAFRMSERNQGAIFMIGDADAILSRSDRPAMQDLAILLSAPLNRLTDEEIINFAKQDGAMVIDAAGNLRSAMVLLRPAASTRAQVSPNTGARHSSAAKMSAETNSVAITVSQDGPIAVFDNGERVLSL